MIHQVQRSWSLLLCHSPLQSVWKMIEGRVSTCRFVWFLNINALAHHIQKSVCLTKGVVAEINLLGALCQDTSCNTNAHERVGENLEHLWWPAHPGKAPWACGDVSENSWQVTNATSTVLKLNAQDPQTNERLGSGRVSSNCWQKNGKKGTCRLCQIKTSGTLSTLFALRQSLCTRGCFLQFSFTQAMGQKYWPKMDLAFPRTLRSAQFQVSPFGSVVVKDGKGSFNGFIGFIGWAGRLQDSPIKGWKKCRFTNGKNVTCRPKSTKTCPPNQSSRRSQVSKRVMKLGFMQCRWGIEQQVVSKSYDLCEIS